VCPGESAQLYAQPGLFTYTWSTGDTTADITVPGPGTYLLMVADSQGCVGSNQFVVSELVPPSPEVVGVEEFCTGDSTMVDAGAGYTQYAWSNNINAQTFYANAPGTYFVTVTDNNGCIGTDSIVISENLLPEPLIDGIFAYCPTYSTEISATSGYVTYEWSTTEVSESITVTSPGTYTVTVTDASGCIGETSVSVSEHVPPDPEIFGANSFCSGFSTNLDAGVYTSISGQMEILYKLSMSTSQVLIL